MIPQRYKIDRRIAVGGMAEIYLGHIDGDRSRPVVVKRILPSLAEQPSFVRAFLREAELLSQLDHPNVARVVGYAGGSEPYIVMDYVRGADLARTLKRFRLLKRWPDIGFVGQVMADLLAGLEHAHCATALGGRPLGIIHRDVTPHNVIVGFDGLTRLVDFGVARTETRSEHTRTGVVKGKIAYLSPEQISGGELDARVDLFAAGIVLYELLCLRHPFAKPNDGATLKSLLDACPVPPRVLRRDIPFALQAVVLRALARRPADRFTDAREMLWALTTAVGTTAGHRTVAGRITGLFPDGPPAESGDQPGSEPLTPPGAGIPPDPLELTSATPSPAAGAPLPPPRRTLPVPLRARALRPLLAVAATLSAFGAAFALLGDLPALQAAGEERLAALSGELPASARSFAERFRAGPGAERRGEAPTAGATGDESQAPEPAPAPVPPELAASEPASAAPLLARDHGAHLPLPAASLDARTASALDQAAAQPAPALKKKRARPPAARSGTLRIEAEAGLSVEINGSPSGVTPLPPQALPAGRHEVLLRHAGGGERLRRVRVLPGREVVLR